MHTPKNSHSLQIYFLVYGTVKSAYLSNHGHGYTSAHKRICNPTPQIGREGHGKPWKDREEPGFSKIKLQYLQKIS